MVIVQAGLVALALTVGLLAATGAVRLWMLYLLAVLLGVAKAFEMPARRSFVTEMVGPTQAANAVGLNNAMLNASRMVGPAAGGVLIGAIGIAPAFLLNAASFLAVIAALLAMDPAELDRQPPLGRGRGQVREGLGYLRASPAVRLVIVLLGAVTALALNLPVVLPLLARFGFGGGPALYGLLAGALAAGSVVGALGAASRDRPTLALLVGSVAGVGPLSLLAALAPTVALEVLVVALIGVAGTAFQSTADSAIQLGAPVRLRGRVTAVGGLVFHGATMVGSVLVGWLSERFGPRSGLLLAAAAGLAAATAAALALRRTELQPSWKQIHQT